MFSAWSNRLDVQEMTAESGVFHRFEKCDAFPSGMTSICNLLLTSLSPFMRSYAHFLIADVSGLTVFGYLTRARKTLFLTKVPSSCPLRLMGTCVATGTVDVRRRRGVGRREKLIPIPGTGGRGSRSVLRGPSRRV